MVSGNSVFGVVEPLPVSVVGRLGIPFLQWADSAFAEVGAFAEVAKVTLAKAGLVEIGQAEKMVVAAAAAVAAVVAVVVAAAAAVVVAAAAAVGLRLSSAAVAVVELKLNSAVAVAVAAAAVVAAAAAAVAAVAVGCSVGEKACSGKAKQKASAGSLDLS